MLRQIVPVIRPLPSAEQPMAAESRTSRGARTGRSPSRGSDLNSNGGPEEDGQTAGCDDPASGLSFRDAQTALELTLAELQAADLDIEEMTSLYKRARSYAERCELVLQRVEQEVQQWDPEQPENPPQPYPG
jgi:exodeoxyribonuclease VII small subunit